MQFVDSLLDMTPVDRPRPDSSQTSCAFFERRRGRLPVVTTTMTPHGDVIDWIPRSSQVRRGRIARPPPVTEAGAPDPEREAVASGFPEVTRGPRGTVPVLRKRLEATPDIPLREYFARYHSRGRVRGAWPHPNPDLTGHLHAGAIQSRTTAFGASGTFSAIRPWLEADRDMSLIQVFLGNHDLPLLQTLEAGCQKCPTIYGDWRPRFFTFYTTNEYHDGDYLGGYNQEVDGWVQVHNQLYPGMAYGPTSVPGGPQYELSIRFQLYRGNWWLRCNGNWIGYYPASLFMGKRRVFSTLGNHADQVMFYGEVFDSANARRGTGTDMGTGAWPSQGWPWSAYMRNLEVQTKLDYVSARFVGAATVTDPVRYNVGVEPFGEGTWGSHLWVGGPGAR